MKDRMKEAREAAGLTQGQAATLIGVSRSLVELWESGRRPVLPVWLEKVASIYAVSEKWLETGEPTDPEAVERVLVACEHLPARDRDAIAGIVARMGAR
jgi:transcriptional regulator with XRE-family HTH domain